LYNYEINKYPKNKIAINEAIDDLNDYGKKLITTFINQNNKDEKKALDNEERLYIYKHSKPPLKLNPWKFSNHIIKEFGTPKIDDVYAPKEVKKRKYKYTVDPFRRPGDYGDYFDKHIGIL